MESVGYASRYAKLVKPGHYTITHNEVLYNLIRTDAAAAENIQLPS